MVPLEGNEIICLTEGCMSYLCDGVNKLYLFKRELFLYFTLINCIQHGETHI